ncbi:MAG TPA: glutamate formimidoyltransferase [Vicinamibacteria bacterium]|nr:glutamate formimidoyltransferase [Vicinamibacteria bacterium]
MKLDPLVEIVPNVSEGRRRDVVHAIADSLGRAEGVWLLDVHSDPSHNRSVLTAVVRPGALTNAVSRLVSPSLELIDMRTQRGEHPCIGSVDVLPFVPLRGLSPTRLQALVRETARTVAESFGLPVFLYADSSPRGHRRELAQLRRGGFQGLSGRMASGELVPDFGPGEPHPTAGAMAVGVRDFLIAYNVNLRTENVAVAKAIARAIRASNRGLPRVQALGFELTPRGCVQVSMNLTDFRVSSLETVFRAVEKEARRHKVEIAGSEIVGLLPRAATFENIVERLALEEPPGILEEKISEAHRMP